MVTSNDEAKRNKVWPTTYRGFVNKYTSEYFNCGTIYLQSVPRECSQVHTDIYYNSISHHTPIDNELTTASDKTRGR